MGEKILIRATDSVFLNAKSIFVEYIDIIKSPYFLFLYAIMSSTDEVLKEPFNTEIIKSMGDDPEALAEWFYCRHSQNPLFDLVPDELMSTLDFNKVDAFMDMQLRENEVLVQGSSPLNFAKVLQRLMTDSLLVSDVFIWYPYDNPVIKNDVHELFTNPDVHFMHGDIVRCIRDVPPDSTYVFSDVTNILVLDELGKLDYSSVIVPVDFAYNLDENKESLIDFEGLQKDHTFKIDRFVSTAE